MRKWMFFLAILALAYILTQINRRKEDRSPFLRRLNETFTILAWILLFAYGLVFLYWLYTQIFK